MPQTDLDQTAVKVFGKKKTTKKRSYLLNTSKQS